MAGNRSGIDGYDDAMTEKLLGIAADVLRSFGSAFGGRHLAIVGGAVPSLLVPEWLRDQLGDDVLNGIGVVPAALLGP